MNQLNALDKALHAPAITLYTKPYNDLKNKFLESRKQQYTLSEIEMRDYALGFLDWVKKDIRDPLVAGNPELQWGSEGNKDIEAICKAVKQYGLEANINLLAAYVDITNPTFANPLLWAEGARNYMSFLDLTPELNIDSIIHKENIENIIEIGKEINNFILRIKSDGDFFFKLCEQYRASINTVTNAFHTHSLSSPALVNSLNNLHNTLYLLHIYIALAFSEDILKDEALNTCLKTKIWNENDLRKYMTRQYTNESKKFTISAIEEAAEEAINELEDLLLQKVLIAQKNRQANYKLVDDIIKELEAFKDIYFGAQLLQLPSSPKDERKAGISSVFFRAPVIASKNDGRGKTTAICTIQ